MNKDQRVEDFLIKKNVIDQYVQQNTQSVSKVRIIENG